MSIIKLALTVCLAAMVSGCLFPEKFDSKITINRDTSYNAKFNGTVASVPSVAQIAKMGAALSERDIAGLKAEAVKMTCGEAESQNSAKLAEFFDGVNFRPTWPIFRKRSRGLGCRLPECGG